MGNPGAGKSTLSLVVNDTATGSIVLGSIRNVKGVVPCTAGIIPYKLQHRILGNIILHDFAGHSEYYSSHSAVIENLLRGSAGVFLIVVKRLEERKENVLALSDVMSATKENNKYNLSDKKEDILEALYLLDSTCLVQVLKSEENVWVVVNKGILLTEVNGILFAPETFKEHVDITGNTGIMSVSGSPK